MEFSPTDIYNQIRSLGIKPGDIVMVHAGLRSVGKILGGPDVLVEELVRSTSPGGATMMYVGCESPFDDVGRKESDGSLRLGDREDWILEHCPAFDHTTGRACRDHGALAEIFRSHNKTICSKHVGWRMAAAGDRATWLMANHPLNYGADVGSPLDKLVKSGGKVLTIGADFDHISLLHYAEGLTDIIPKKLVHIKVPLLQDGKRVWVDVVEHNSSTGIVDWPDRYFADLIERYIQEHNVQSGKIGHAKCHVFEAPQLVQFAVKQMELDYKK